MRLVLDRQLEISDIGFQKQVEELRARESTHQVQDWRKQDLFNIDQYMLKYSDKTMIHPATLQSWRIYIIAVN